MPSLQDQLKEVQQELDSLKSKYAQHFRLANWFSTSEVVAGFVSFIIVVLICILIFKLDFIDEGFLIFIFFYGGIFLVGYLYENLTVFFKFLIRKHLKIDTNQSKTFETIRDTLSNRKYRIEKEIKEELKHDQYLQENRFITKLDNFVNAVTNKTLNYNAAIEQSKLLEKEHEEIKRNGYQIHTRVFYDNRFSKIRTAINHYTDPQPPTIPKETSKPQTKNDVIISNVSKPVEVKTSTSNNTTTFIPPPIEPKPYIPIDKQEEKKVEVPKPPDEKKTPVIENKPALDKKIVPITPKEITISTNKAKSIPKEEEKTSSELFGTPNTEVVKQESTKTNQTKQPVKIDFPKLNEHRHNIGELGELYIFAKEQNHLVSQGKIKQSKEVIHVSLNSDSEGYDIVSFTDTGDKKYIEVKTTTGNEFEPFYLSTSEMDAMNRLNNYWIYRVYNFNIDLKKGDLYKIDCKKDLGNYYNIQASSFKVTPKR